MRFLVTGATGFAGAHMINRIIDAGHEVVAMARNLETAPGIENIVGKNINKIEFVYGDLAELDSLSAIFAKWGVIIFTTKKSNPEDMRVEGRALPACPPRPAQCSPPHPIGGGRLCRSGADSPTPIFFSDLFVRMNCAESPTPLSVRKEATTRASASSSAAASEGGVQRRNAPAPGPGPKKRRSGQE